MMSYRPSGLGPALGLILGLLGGADALGAACAPPMGGQEIGTISAGEICLVTRRIIAPRRGHGGVIDAPAARQAALERARGS